MLSRSSAIACRKHSFRDSLTRMSASVSGTESAPPYFLRDNFLGLMSLTAFQSKSGQRAGAALVNITGISQIAVRRQAVEHRLEGKRMARRRSLGRGFSGG